MLPNGPPDGRPAFGSHVSNWLGAPHSQSRMTFFSAFFAAAAKIGFVNRPVKLVTAAGPGRGQALEKQPAMKPMFARSAMAGCSGRALHR